ncbi:hypothetical protein EOM89_03955 [Candidatus Falkowbacteria bacterium]|nr:hypothetical protein [Candidatus Falkowbacteria bacterium]
MKAFKILKKFNNEEDGAVTVDWVVLTAAVVGLGLAALSVIRGGVQAQTGKINDVLTAEIVKTF